MMVNNKLCGIFEDISNQIAPLDGLQKELTLTFLDALAIKEIFYKLIKVLDQDTISKLNSPQIKQIQSLITIFKNEEEKGLTLIPILLEENFSLRTKIFSQEIPTSDRLFFLKRYRETSSHVVKRAMLYSLAIKNFILHLITQQILQISQVKGLQQCRKGTKKLD